MQEHDKHVINTCVCPVADDLMSRQIGFRALRFDFVKGYAPRFQTVRSLIRQRQGTQMLALFRMRWGLGVDCEEYVRAAGSPYAVAENWNGDANGPLPKIALKASKFHSVCYPSRSYIHLTNSLYYISSKRII